MLGDERMTATTKEAYLSAAEKGNRSGGLIDARSLLNQNDSRTFAGTFTNGMADEPLSLTDRSRRFSAVQDSILGSPSI